MLHFLLSDWFNLVPPWLREYGTVDAGMISQRLGNYGIMHGFVIIIAALYGFASRNRRDFFSLNPLMSAGIFILSG